jgi:hypothetical protein
MPKLRFSDGMTINTDGPYRIIRESDGLYVTGNGFLCAVETIEEGNEMIDELEGIDNKWAGKHVKDMEP